MTQVPFASPKSGAQLTKIENKLEDASNKSTVGQLVEGVYRFIENHQDYAANFGYQWKKWDTILSDSRNSNHQDFKKNVLLKRTNFDKFDMKDKTILECGCGGGDDTEVLLKFPFKEVHAFDLSRAVERSAKYNKDSRLVLSQASIFEIPYPDESFDFVFCHRVLQHTPDPELALRKIGKKVKPGGVLFAHSYHDSKRYRRHFKYKYRFITKKLNVKIVENFLEIFAPLMHLVNKFLYKTRIGKFLAFHFIPLEHVPSYAEFSDAELLELEKLITFDALTPMYDLPMKWETMKRIVEEEGFEIKYFNDNPTGSPIWVTAQKKK